VARPDRAIIGIGSGFATYGTQLRERLGLLQGEAPNALPRASGVARLAARAFGRGEAVDAANAQPVYLRDKVALTLEEQGKRA
ncbi:MAG TPA: tRNA (adenosine(37)-N6)-threonylcarbamoyltransferase complex dimerization subunit type 1 TsaB, partial [Xanthomonadales bacterium]|nr:tRNA (adenosine(37)-N6)-threonylcarbamoyltransferase complex dimerization subunit type 1 TsaB [Xanthomonadales bacterium]